VAGDQSGEGGVKNSIVPAARIERAILLLIDQKVLLDADLGALYGVPTKALLQAVRRNLERFPHNFMFQTSKQEFAILMSQIVTKSLERAAHGAYCLYRTGRANAQIEGW
jgi:ORF6N domain